MSTMRRLVVLLLPVAFAGSARAATWSAPVTLSQTPHTFVGPLRADLGTTGAAIVAWPWQDGIGGGAAVGASVVGGAPRGGAFGPERAAPAGLLDVATYADSRTIALAQRVAGGAGPTGALRQRLSVAFGSTAGTFGAPRPLTVAPIVFLPRLAANRHGQVLVAWVEATRTAAGATRRIVRVAERPSSTGFHAPGTLSGAGRADALAVAVGDNGDMVAVVVRDGRVLARIKRRGHAWGAFAELARAEARSSTRFDLHAAVDARGRIRIVWRRHRFRSAHRPGRLSLEGTVLPRGGSRFRPAQVIEADGAGRPVLRQAGASWVLAYVRDTAGVPRPAVRLAAASGAFGDALEAAPGRGGVRGVDVSYATATGYTVAWVQPVGGQDGDGQAHAAVLAPGATAFGPVEDVSPAEAVHEVRLVGDEPVAVWSARPDGTGPGVPIAQIRSVVRSATRLR